MRSIWEAVRGVIGACVDLAVFVAMCVVFAALAAVMMVIVGLIALGSMLMDALDTARGVRRSS